MASNPRRSYTTFSAAEVSRITGVSQDAQRDMRRRQYLPATGGRRARFTALAVARLLVMRRLVERGFVPAAAAAIASKAEKSVLWFALAGRDEAIDVIGPAEERARYISRRSSDRLSVGFADVDQLAGLTDRERRRFCVVMENGEPVWRNTLADLFEEERGWSAFVLDLLALGEALAEAAARPLLTIEFEVQPASSDEKEHFEAKSVAYKKRGPTTRGLTLQAASTYLGVDAPTFERMVGDGLMPLPRRLGGCEVWDRTEIDRAFDTLAGEARE